MSPKEKQFTFRLSDGLNDRIEEVMEFMTNKTGLKVTKTQVIESAVEEGLKVLKDKIEGK